MDYSFAVPIDAIAFYIPDVQTVCSLCFREGTTRFAFLEYEDPRDAEESVRKEDGADMGGSRMRVRGLADSDATLCRDDWPWKRLCMACLLRHS